MTNLTEAQIEAVRQASDWLADLRDEEIAHIIAAVQAVPPPDDPEPPKDDEDEYGPDREETDDR